MALISSRIAGDFMFSSDRVFTPNQSS